MLPARRRALDAIQNSQQQQGGCEAEENASEAEEYASEVQGQGQQEQEELGYDEDAWRSFSMDTPAGRILSKLYQGQRKPVVSYPKLRRRPRGAASTCGQPSAAAGAFIPAGGRLGVDSRAGGEWRDKQKAVKAPRMGGERRQWHPIELIGSKKREGAIKAESSDAARRDFWGPGRTKSLSTAAEKERLQAAFTWQGGKALPEGMLPGKSAIPTALTTQTAAKASAAAAAATGARRDDPTAAKQDRFDEIMVEIEQRKSFLDNMRSMGEARPVERRIQAEIQDRVRELEALDSELT